MTRLPFWTYPFATVSRESRAYRFGDKPVWGAPRHYTLAVFTVVLFAWAAALAVALRLLAVVGVAVDVPLGWWVAPALIAVMLATTEIRDGKRADQLLASKLNRLCRLPLLLGDYTAVRRPRPVRDESGRVWHRCCY